MVSQKQLKKAAQKLCDAFPTLEMDDLPVVIRLRDRESNTVLIDLMKPLQQPYCEVFKHTCKESSEGEVYRVPSLEMALVMKFSAMTSLNRAAEDKLLRDAADFTRMVKNNPEFDRDKLAEIGLLLYPDGGKDVLEMVRQVLAGERIKI